MTSDAPRKHTIALLDDHVLIVDGLAHWIGANAPDFSVVAALGSWEELRAHPQFPPEVVAMARTIDSPESLEERIRFCIDAGAKVVVMSTEDGDDAEGATLAAGADAFVPKSRPAEAVLEAARSVLGVRPGAGRSLSLRESGMLEVSAFDDWHRRVLRLYAQGESTVDIALIEGVRFERVRTALKTIRAAYVAQGRRVDTRDELLRRAAEDGYLVDED
ncbi:response regulator transcription factor [Agreia sp. COWG]|uniref:response regulator transcription factor n=1 Tax=Agreia sp. COWG TaxID=2773266 RepID=UPI0019297A65|nr:response regulator transcription factor [Agreia sp. COWG]CAD5992383.1 Response regulatory domain-containing protein [Agreia sp. COWG]